MTPPRRYRFPKWHHLLILSLVGLAYGRGLITTFGYTDDFWLYFSGDNVAGTYLAAGRPVAAAAWQLSTQLVSELADLRWLRGAGVFGIGMIAILLSGEFFRLFRHRILAVAAALGTGFLPAMTVMANWATCWIYPWAICAVLLAERMIRGAIIRYRRHRLGSLAQGTIGLGLILLALLTYQPTITWFWLPVLLQWLSPRLASQPAYRRRLLVQCGLGVLLFLLGFIALKLYFAVTGIPPQSRAQLLTDPVPKLHALLRVQIPLCLNLWHVIDVSQKFQVLMIGGLVGLVVTSGLGKSFFARANRRAAMIWLAGVLLILAASHAHWLLIQENPKNYRTAMTVASGTAVLFIWSLWIHASASGTGRWLLTGCGGVLILLTLFQAEYNSRHYWTEPYSTAHRFLVDQLASRLTDETRSIHLIRQSADEGLVGERNIYSFGKPYTDFPDDDVVHLEGILQAALIDSGHADRLKPLVVSHSQTDIQSIDPATLIIDFRQLKNWAEPSSR